MMDGKSDFMPPVGAGLQKVFCLAMWSFRKINPETTRRYEFGHLALPLVADYIFSLKHDHRINIVPKTQASLGGHIG